MRGRRKAYRVEEAICLNHIDVSGRGLIKPDVGAYEGRRRKISRDLAESRDPTDRRVKSATFDEAQDMDKGQTGIMFRYLLSTLAASCTV